MANDTTMLLGFALLAGGAYLYTKKDKGQGAGSYAAPTGPRGPVADQGKDPGVAPDAAPTSSDSAPSFATELAPESAQTPSGGNTTADDLSYRERLKRDYQAISLQGSRSGKGTRVLGIGTPIGPRGIQIDDKYESEPDAPPPPSDGTFPSDPREEALLLE